jgi:hypothetical protein
VNLRNCQLVIWAVLLGAASLAAQTGDSPQPAATPRPPTLRKLIKKRAAEQARRPASPTDLLERLQKLAPEQREAVFETFPEERREQVRRRFEAFNKLTGEERDRLGENLIAFINLAPQRQELARVVFRRFAGMAKERQETMQAELKMLGTLSPEDRRSRVNADEFRNRFSAEEKILMFDMLRIFPGRRATPAKPAELTQQQ